MFNHGSTGRGQNKSLYSRTVAPAGVANYFVERGWMVLFPQRRGRGKSGGAYGVGLAPDGSGYSCDVDIAIAGFERAVEDSDAVVNHLRNRSDVDPNGSSFTAQLIVLGLIYIVIEFFAAIVWAVSGAAIRSLRPSARKLILMNKIIGALMLGAAAMLATTKRA
ncbi:hypothetical protein N8D56_27225 (plasmid) [Devosia sp. A8/3-2]|nr:hypothetical protein N8D56_27225 [Devosia sp. A8/3-2]